MSIFKPKIVKNYIANILSRKLNSTPFSPLFITLELTRKCNLKCKGCDLWRTEDNEPNWIEDEISKNTIYDLLEELNQMGLLLVYLSGGEPLLRDDIFEIIEKTDELDLECTIVTNGTLLSEENIIKLVNSGIDSVLVSIDSYKPHIHDEIRGVKGTFKKATNGIKRLNRISNDKVRVGINTIVTNRNIKVSNMAKLAKKLNVDGVRLLPYHFDEYPQNTYNSQNKGLTVFNDKELEELEKEIEKFIKITNKNGFYTNYKSFLRQIPEYYRNGKTIENCYAGNMFCTIDSKGNFYPCFPISSNMNINEIKFNKIWKSNEINHLRNNAIKNNNCKKCFQACYKEMSMRTSPISLLKNFKNQFRELSFFTD